MSFLSSETVIAGLLAIAIGLYVYSLLVPRTANTFSPTPPEGVDSQYLGLLSRIGGEIYSSLPSSIDSGKRANPRVEALLVRSGNPWNFTVDEFIFFQFITALVGFTMGWGMWFILNLVMNFPIWLVVGGSTILGYFIPRLKYRDQAKKRDIDFKRQLPEALDLIIISLSGGSTFAQALRESLPNMQDGVLKEEFQKIMNNVDTGRTLSEALTQFTKRAPNESIKTFITAVREASELNVPLIDVLRSRAEASRQEFFALIHTKTASLSSKMMAILTPTLVPALLLVVLTPAASSLMNAL